MRTKSIRMLVGGAAVFVAVAGGVGMANHAPDHASVNAPGMAATTPAYLSYPPCDSGDGSGPRPCFWSASWIGDDSGRAFYVDTTGSIHNVGG